MSSLKQKTANGLLWGAFSNGTVQVLQALDNVKVSDNHRLGTPWTGAWKKLMNNDL